MDQRSGYGDLWFADGHVIPQDQVPGNFGPDFVARPLHIPEPGKWYCVELMVQANTVGARDGRVATWIDGKLIADWQNVRFRSVATLKIDQFELVLGAASNPAADRQWFDHVVVAKSYIGPLATKVTPPPVEPPEEPTLMELAAMINAVQAYAETLQAGLDAIAVRLAALEARPTDPEIAARVAAVEAAIADLKSFDKKISDL
jgi:prepilin-type processing-associated H-X9-DG protein